MRAFEARIRQLEAKLPRPVSPGDVASRRLLETLWQDLCAGGRLLKTAQSVDRKLRENPELGAYPGILACEASVSLADLDALDEAIGAVLRSVLEQFPCD